jgi:4-oxalocrotonate tautomerase
MPIVNIVVASQLNREQKAALAKGITAAVTEVTKAPAQAVTVIIQEVERENIATAGVLLADRT